MDTPKTVKNAVRLIWLYETRLSEPSAKHMHVHVYRRWRKQSRALLNVPRIQQLSDYSLLVRLREVVAYA